MEIKFTDKPVCATCFKIIAIKMPASVYIPLSGEAGLPQSVAKEATEQQG